MTPRRGRHGGRRPGDPPPERQALDAEHARLAQLAREELARLDEAMQWRRGAADERETEDR